MIPVMPVVVPIIRKGIAPPKHLWFTSCSDILPVGDSDMVLFPGFRFIKQLDLSFSDYPWHLGTPFGPFRHPFGHPFRLINHYPRKK